MTEESAKSGLGGAALGAAAAVIVVALGGWALFGRGGPEPAEPAKLAEVPAPAATPEAAPAPAATPEAAPEGAGIAPPRFDVVRVETDGSATVAGSAVAGAAVSLRIAGTEVAAATADAQGRFAALFTLSPSEVPRILQLVMLLDGKEYPAKETVALAPVAGPEQVAAATPEPAAEAAPAETAPAEAAAPPAALLVTEEGVKVLQSGAETPAEPAARVTIELIAYPGEGQVQIGGKGQPGQSVRLYLDDGLTGEAPVGADGGWSVLLEAVAPGIYTLRADQIGADGKVTARFETPFKRETPEALAAALAPPQALDTGPAPGAEAAAASPDPAPADPAPAETVAAEAPAPAAASPAPDAPETAAAPAAAQTAPAAAAGPATPDPAPAAQAPVSVTVQPGYTLWGIAEAQFGSGYLYVQVFEANKDQIRNPDLIYPGQVFTLPGAP